MYKYIRQAYKVLSKLNTLRAWATGDPNKIIKHYIRKSAWKRIAKTGRRL